MKKCTTYKVDDGELKVYGYTGVLVDDDHEYGWVNGSYHHDEDTELKEKDVFQSVPDKGFNHHNIPFVKYDRDLLLKVLVYHQHNEDSSCICGWAKLGKSHPEHVVNIYERMMTYG